MGRENPSKLYRMTEDEARAFLERVRWPEGPVCHHCQSKDVVPIGGKSARPGLYRCRKCRKQLTVTTGTIFHRSHLPLSDWVYIFARMCASKKGISALQISRELGIAYKSAWHALHRVRHAMRCDPLKGMLEGVVEVDSTYVGGKARGRVTPEQRRRARAAGKPIRRHNKVEVVGLIERGGRARARVQIDEYTLKDAILEAVDTSATIQTDEHIAFRGIGKHYEGGHHTVNHSRYEYYRHSDGAGINEAEAFFGLLKRGITGAYHRVSKEHLQRYCDEFSFRWSHRKVSDTERTIAAIRCAEGQRLMYREPAKRTA